MVRQRKREAITYRLLEIFVRQVQNLRQKHTNVKNCTKEFYILGIESRLDEPKDIMLERYGNYLKFIIHD